MTWTQTTLSAVSDIQTGPFGSQLHAADYVVSGTPAIMPQNIVNGRISTNGIARVSNKDIKRLVKYCVQPGDIVFSRRGDVERHALITANESTWLCGTGCLRVRPNSSLIKPEYLHYYLSTPASCAWISGHAHGSTMPNLNTTILGETPIKFPNRDMQIRICGILTALDAKIDCNSRINDNLHQQAQALFSHFYERATNCITFTSIIQVLGGGTPKTSEPTYWNGRIPFFTPKDVGCPYTLMTEKTITEDGLNHCNSRLYPVNTVFVTARGTVGKVGLSGYPMAMNQSCYALVGNGIDQLLVYFYTLETVNALKHKASGAVFDAITTKDFSSENVMQLSESDACIFLSIASPLFATILSNCLENQRLVSLRDTLLPKLMSGEIDVSNIQL